MKRVFKHEMIEIIVPANSTSTKFQIPDQPNLRDTNILGVEAYTDDVTPKSPLSGEAVVTETELKSIFLTFQDNAGNEFNKQAPLLQYKTIQSSANGFIDRDFKNFAGQVVNYPKSYITMPVALGNVVNKSVLLSIFYIDKTYKESRSKFSDRK